MLYYFFDILNEMNVPGAGLFQYISFRAGVASFLSLLITIIFGKPLIRLLKKKQFGETIRDLGLKGQLEKEGTPTMGGIIIIIAIVLPTFLFAKLDNIYIILLLVTALWIGVIGFLDDYLKIKKKNKEGLRGKFKVLGQVSLGLFVGVIMIFHEEVVTRNYTGSTYEDNKELISTIPFFAYNEFHYKWLMPDFLSEYTWVAYLLLVIFIISAVSNGANITDGLDGLATGISAIIGITLGVFAYISGNAIFSDYLNVMFVPYSGELAIFCAAFVGACIGFLWYNSYPAQVFMGDTGSLSLGALIAVLAIILRKELLIPIICGIFLIENLSVIIQVTYFKYTKRKYGEGRRVFLISPIHHHFQKQGIHEAKIVMRFFAIGILLALFALAILKIR